MGETIIKYCRACVSKLSNEDIFNTDCNSYPQDGATVDLCRACGMEVMSITQEEFDAAQAIVKRRHLFSLKMSAVQIRVRIVCGWCTQGIAGASATELGIVSLINSAEIDGFRYLEKHGQWCCRFCLENKLELVLPEEQEK